MFHKNKLKAQMTLLGVTAKDLAKKLDISEATFYRKMQRDGDFTRNEINILIQVLQINNPEEIFFAEELA